MGVYSLGELQFPLPAALDANDEYLRMDKKTGLYTTFSFQDNEMPVSICDRTPLAKIDFVSDFNAISKTFLDILPVGIHNKSCAPMV